MSNKKYIKAIELPVFDIIAEAVAELQLETYVIGGYVRDFLLRRPYKKDIDFVAVGSGIDLAKKVAQLIPGKPKVQIFKTYGTAMVRYPDKVSKEIIDLEFVGARKESYSKNSRNPEVETGTLQDDQNRRDFTINAMAISLNQNNYGELLDPFNGLEDLGNKIIKTPLDPDITYSDDPLRMMRAIRFATQLSFKIEEESLKAIKRNSERLKIISSERIVDELHKILMTEKPSIGLKLLYDSNLMVYILPELTALSGVEQIKGQKHKDNFYHTLQVVDNIAKTTDNLWLRWAALLHDIGKAPTKKFDKKVGWTFHGHEFIGSKMVKKIFRRLHMPLNEKMKYVEKIVALSSRPVILAENVTDSAVRRLVFDAGTDIDDLMTHCEADITTKNKKREKQYRNNFKKVRLKIREVEERDRVRNFQPPITGEMIMDTFNLKPCREIGTLKESIKDAILDGVISNDYDEAYAYMIKKGTKMGLTPKEK
ncbi:MAG: tRNA nucleotidyltransferase [Bacteroidetes bacterium]|nr:MAG: tRNA nucleotidyltransferase [Bacteroidota bacterium]